MKRFAAVILTVVMMTTLVAGCGSKDAESEKGTLNVYCFGDYFDPELEERFEEATGYDVVVDLFDTNEEMYPVIKNNTADYDVICASDYTVSYTHLVRIWTSTGTLSHPLSKNTGTESTR